MWLWIVGIVSSFGLVGIVVAVIVVPGVAVPILQKLVAWLLKCKPCMALLVAIALLFAGALYGIHVERQRSAARIEKLRTAAAAAAVERDGEVRADLEKSFGPAMAANRALIKSLQDKVDQYANSKPAVEKPAGAPAPGVRSCKLGDAAGLLRPPKARGSAGAAKGGAADYLRRKFGADRGADVRAR